MIETIFLKDEYITLGQALKDIGVIGTGGAAKWYLAENPVKLNDTTEDRRGKKLVDGDLVTLSDGTQFKISGK